MKDLKDESIEKFTKLIEMKKEYLLIIKQTTDVETKGLLQLELLDVIKLISDTVNELEALKNQILTDARNLANNIRQHPEYTNVDGRLRSLGVGGSRKRKTRKSRR